MNLVDKIQNILGKTSGWALALMAGLTFITVVLRYVFNFGSIALQELSLYLHASSFLLAMGYALREGSHVRVDIFFEKMSERKKAYVNLLGIIFLFVPFLIVILWFCYPSVMDSIRVLEKSQDPGGLPFVYLLKSLMLLFPVAILLQGASWFLSELGRLRT